MDLSQAVLAHVVKQRFAEAEATLAAVLADRANHLEDSCAGLILNNLAAFVALSGRTAEAETWRSDRSMPSRRLMRQRTR